MIKLDIDIELYFSVFQKRWGFFDACHLHKQNTVLLYR